MLPNLILTDGKEPENRYRSLFSQMYNEVHYSTTMKIKTLYDKILLLSNQCRRMHALTAVIDLCRREWPSYRSAVIIQELN